MDRDTYKMLFHDTDNGQILNINLFDTTGADWWRVLDYVPRHFAFKYFEDGVEAPLPDYSAITERRCRATLLLSIDISGMKINAHFFREDAIQFDILPREVDTPEKGDEILKFMQTLSSLLYKSVFLNEEHGSASDQSLRERALAYIELPGNTFRVNP